jgi:Fic family protein
VIILPEAKMLFATPKLEKVEIDALEEIAQIRKQVRHMTGQPRKWSGMLRQMMVASAIRGSNSIEGYKASVEDAMAAMQRVEPFEAQGETWNALTSYQSAMTFVLQLANDPSFKYEEGFIRSLHYMMLQYDLSKHPGNWRPSVVFVRDESNKRIVYEAPPRDLVEPLMTELIQALNGKSQTPEVVRAAMAHLNFVMIHPFSDGNGRMGRCLHTLVLAREGILEPEFCSIEEYLGFEQQAYYDVLARVGQGSWHPKNDARPWLRFIMKAHLVQAYRILWLNDQFDRVWHEAERIGKEKSLPDRTLQLVADAIVGLKIKNATYRAFVGISENLASRDLKVLVDKGILVPTGEKRGRVYEPSPKMKEIRKKTWQKFKLPEPFKAKLPEQGTLPGFEDY